MDSQSLKDVSGRAKTARSVAQSTSEVFMDLRAALKRLGGDSSLLRDIVGFFLEDSPGLLQQIDDGIQSGDAEEVARAAHTLKGLSSSFDAEECVAAAFRVEQLARDGHLSEAREAAPELRAAIDALDSQLRQASL